MQSVTINNAIYYHVQFTSSGSRLLAAIDWSLIRLVCDIDGTTSGNLNGLGSKKIRCEDNLWSPESRSLDKGGGLVGMCVF